LVTLLIGGGGGGQENYLSLLVFYAVVIIPRYNVDSNRPPALVQQCHINYAAGKRRDAIHAKAGAER
jgi:hypothetical protein